MTIEEVFEEIKKERAYQENKWGNFEQHPQSLPGYLLIMKKELEEAENGWMKNSTGRNHVLHEILQVAAVAIACLEEHGNKSSLGNSDK